MKKKILMVSEASFCQSGYGVYTKEALTRLHKNPNLEVAELACNVEHGDPMLESTPWKCFPNRPKRGDVEGNKQFDVNPYNRFGFFELNRVLMNFQPDFVMDIRDHWHMTFEESSPFRDFFKLAWMPTVDAEPQNQLWINSYEDADALFTYTEFGRDTLFNQSVSIRNKFFGVPSPGASDNFKRLNKSTIREKMEIPENSVVFGTVMRNQRRKLFPDLFAAFRKFLDRIADAEREKAFLYCHTCHPDVGWDIPELLKEYDLGNNTFFSYQCISCKEVTPKRYNDWCTQCEKCSNFTTHMVGPNNPMEEIMLNDVYNAFDVYVQWANSEGFGLSVAEAAHVGLPVVAVNYSGMASVVSNLNGISITPISYYKELETGCKRAVPNNDVLADVMELLFKNEKLRKDIGQECYINSKKRYMWDDNIKVWEDYFVNAEVPSHEFTWKSPPRLFNPPKEMPEVIKTLTTVEKVNWLFANVLGRPDMIGRAIWKRMTRDLMYGLGLSHFIPGFYFVDASYMCDFERKPMGYSLEDAFKECLAIRHFWNHYEKQRELINCQK